MSRHVKKMETLESNKACYNKIFMKPERKNTGLSGKITVPQTSISRADSPKPLVSKEDLLLSMPMPKRKNFCDSKSEKIDSKQIDVCSIEYNQF